MKEWQELTKRNGGREGERQGVWRGESGWKRGKEGEGRQGPRKEKVVTLVAATTG
jgi:hypothetical protein